MRRIVAKKKWETVKFNKDDYDDRFADLIDVQELTDYVVEDASDSTKSKAKKRKASQIDLNDETKKVKLDDGNREKEKLNLEKMSKKKKKQKIKQLEKVESTKPIKDCINSNNDSSDDDSHTETAEDTNVDLDGMSDWDPLFVPPEILRALKEKNFTSPTPIQSLALPSAIRDRLDVIGAAETGSGKTLAFAIPIVARLLQMEHDYEQQVEAMEVDEDVKDDDINEEEGDDDNIEDDKGDNNNNDDDHVEDEENDVGGDIAIDELKQVEPMKRKSLKALILTPTRELALQIKEHIEAITKYTNVKCVVLVGGLAAVKQMRKLSEQPEIVIATPGRLWQLIQDREPHVFRMEGLKFLVIDEVDRMMEQNHFVELEQILNHIHQKCHQKKQVFVFSATLTFVHSKPKRMDLKKKKRMKDLTVEEKLNSLKTKLRMSNKPKIFDLTKGRNMMAQKLVEQRMNCQADEKDLYLYYFLKTHPGRTIIFANSKEIIKKINSLMTVLHFSPIRLCADMDQKLRLKNVERFKELENGLLIATDVAARGLDIPDVQYVVHYHVPMTAENYVHRSGRTARSNKDGLSVIFISPQEENIFQRIMANLKRGKDLSKLDVDRSEYQPMVQVVKLAQTIEKERHRDRKQKNQKNWLNRLAEEADMIFDDDDDDDEDKSDGEHTKEMEHNIWKRKMEGLQMELNQLLGIESKSKRKKKNKKTNQKP